MSNTGYIYMHTAPSGLSYIGKSLGTKGHRWKDHVNAAYDSKYKEHDYPLQRAIRKYGEGAFTTQILEDCVPEERLAELEIFYISKYDTFQHGYNQTTGGEGSPGVRGETARSNIAKANKERVWTEAMVDKMRSSKLGTTMVSWFIVTPEGEYQEFTDVNKKDYATSKGWHVGSFKNMFSKSKNVGHKVTAGKFCGYTFGNVGEVYE